MNQYMTESGILLFELPMGVTSMRIHPFRNRKRGELRKYLSECIEENGEENSYMLCSFGSIIEKDKDELAGILSELTTREREYILV